MVNLRMLNNECRKKQLRWVPVAHACNPSYSGGRDQEDHVLKPAWANNSQDPISKKPITKKGYWSGSRCRPWVQVPVLQKKRKKTTPSHFFPLSRIATFDICCVHFQKISKHKYIYTNEIVGIHHSENCSLFLTRCFEHVSKYWYVSTSLCYLSLMAFTLFSLLCEYKYFS
jgi:hypothetical protein